MDTTNLPTPRWFTGVGATDITEDEQRLCSKIAYVLCSFGGYALRSGKAPGADQAFQRGMERAESVPGYVPADHEIYLPWEQFESHAKVSNKYDIWELEELKETMRIASETHPAYQNLKPGQLAFHHRNIHQTLGRRLDQPSDFVLYCAKDGKDGLPEGGTRTAVKVAVDRGIPVFNMRGKRYEEVIHWVKGVIDKKYNLNQDDGGVVV